MKTPIIEPYVMFSGRCEEALEFYKSALSAQIGMIMRFKDSPEEPPMPMPDGWKEKVMHCDFHVGESHIMASDGCGGDEPIQGIMLSLTVADEAAATEAFQRLSEDGEVQMPLGKTFWSPCFGMVKDQFGVGWMVSVPECTNP